MVSVHSGWSLLLRPLECSKLWQESLKKAVTHLIVNNKQRKRKGPLPKEFLQRHVQVSEIHPISLHHLKILDFSMEISGRVLA